MKSQVSRTNVRPTTGIEGTLFLRAHEFFPLTGRSYAILSSTQTQTTSDLRDGSSPDGRRFKNRSPGTPILSA